MQRDLDGLEELLAAYPGKRIRVLPGNYDLDLQRTALKDRDLHKRVTTVEGVRIAGYGGAKAVTPGIPEDLVVPFREYPDGGSLFSEPRDFFCRERPDLVVLLMPPYGYLDRLRNFGHLGSVGVRDYMDQFSPQVILCGHMHECWGVIRRGGTVLVNPSNFGAVPDIENVRQAGYFFEFIMEGTSYRVGTLRQVDKGKVYDVADYVLDSQATIVPLVLDEKRMRNQGRERASEAHHLKQIRDFRSVRDFFRKFQTEATQERMKDLRRVYRKLSSVGEEVAFDVLGSVNFGMSEPGSDVDLVIYRRCACKHALPETTCTLPRSLWQCFEDLAMRYKVDVTDCVNIEKVEAAIRAEDADCQALQRFVLYRAICTPINLRMIRKTENMLLGKPELKKKVDFLLREYLNMMVRSQSHILSFKKYESRLLERGGKLPQGVEKKLRAYLGQA